jgi:TonB-linked SusC/RagA family outer membrane protein
VPLLAFLFNLKFNIMIGKLLGRSWAVMVMAVMFATAVNAQELASARSNSPDSKQTSERLQERTITGKVISGDNDEGLPGVNVIVKGTTTGGITDIEGKYTVTVPDDNAALIFSSVGYETQEVPVGTRSIIDITLMPDVTALEEIVVIGYGTQKKKDLTGAIVNVQAEAVEKYKPTSVSEILRTTAPGLTVGYATNARNVPDFNVRGDASMKADLDNDGDREEERAANRPLIVVDGVIFLGDLAEINPNDIESVDVLKDASAAAIYGSQATNGVVIFTTKKGQIGKPKINVSTRIGLVTGADRISTYKGGDEVLNWLTDMNESVNELLLEPWTKFRDYYSIPEAYRDDWLAANGLDPNETDPDVINLARVDNFGFQPIERENFRNGVVNDWQDYLFHTGVRQDYDVSVSGRNEKVSYYFSLGYSDRESVQIWESFETITSRLNLDVSLADFLNIGVNASFSFQDEGRQPVGNGSYRVYSPYDQPWAIGEPQTRENLNGQAAGSNITNPYQDPSWNTRLHNRYMINPTLFAKLTLPLGFSFRMDYTPRFDTRKRFDFDESGNNPKQPQDEGRRRHNETFAWQWNNILSWDRQFGEHRFNVTALYNAEKTQNWFTDAQTNTFLPTAALGYSGMSLGTNPSINSYDETNSRIAMMGRVNYAYSDRYNFSASIRRDGFSRFGKNNLYGNFPSLSAAWTITNESFMASAPSFLNYLKLRVSWGINGNSSGLEDYNSYARFSNNQYLNYDNGYIVAPYIELTRFALPNLSWEKTESFNFGLDFGVIGSRLTGSFDIYTSETQDLLLDQSLPEVTGFTTSKTNVGTLQNWGWDLGLNSTNVSAGDFVWTSTLNITFKQNKIKTLGNDPVAVLDAEGNEVIRELDDLQNEWFIGENKDVIWDWDVDGVYQVGDTVLAAKYGFRPGDFRIIDQNGDSLINADDKVFLGLRDNPWYLTFRNDFEWKGFDFGLVFLAKIGYLGETTQPFNNSQQYIKNHNWYNIPYWTPLNPINDAAGINSKQLSGHQIAFSRSYLRLQNVSLGYSLPSSVLEKLNFDRVRLAINVENAAVFTDWPYGDPESQREMPRTYSFSLDVTF